MGIKQWNFPKIDESQARIIASECQIDIKLANILLARGFKNSEDVHKFLNSSSEMSDPFELKDMQKAVGALQSAIDRDEKITIFGDYDVDGITSTAILYLYLKTQNANVDFIIANRADGGYGLNLEVVERLKTLGTNLLITVDNGISAAPEVKVAYENGIKVIVTDHHEAPEVLPDCEAIINPKQDGCESFSEICGAFVVLKFVAAHAQSKGQDVSRVYHEYADFVALATIADICPLVCENRQIVTLGLEALKNRPKFALKYLIDRAVKNPSAITAEDVAFYITPKLNAAGRMGDATRAADMLVCDDEEEIVKLADDILNDNEKRREITEKYAQEVLMDLKNCDERVKISCLPNIPEGIVGIIAARVTETFGAPSIVLSQAEDGTATGSGRSVSGFSVYDAVKSAEEILLRYGGHNQAAGLTINTDDFMVLKQKIDEYAKKFHETMPFNQVFVDLDLPANELSFSLCSAQNLLEPIGSANVRPIFCIKNALLAEIVPISSGKHLRLNFSMDGVRFSIMKFGTTTKEFHYKKGDKLDLCVNLSQGEFAGKKQLNIRLIDLRTANLNQEKVLSEVRLFEAFLRDESPKVSEELIPMREDFINFFKFLSLNPSLENIDTLELALRLNRPNEFFKTAVMVKAFSEVGIVTFDRIANCMNIFLNEKAQKADLESAPTMVKLKNL